MMHPPQRLFHLSELIASDFPQGERGGRGGREDEGRGGARRRDSQTSSLCVTSGIIEKESKPKHRREFIPVNGDRLTSPAGKGNK